MTGIRTERVMGIETEFGIVHADPAERERRGAASSVLLSHLVVGAYALLENSEGERGTRVRWDYGDETPLRDARGFELQRAAAHPSQLTDAVPDAHGAHVPSIDLDAPLQAPEIAPDGTDADILQWAVHRSIGNAVLRNGARWYVDHAHPEYSGPEVTTARDGVIWHRAGERIARRAMDLLEQAGEVPAAVLYKNNTDSKGSSYGTHENYLLDRAVPFDRVVEALTPFLVTRQILVGAGRVGLGTRSQEPGYQISSRADFFEEEVGLETTMNRPIINTRDEPHADASRHRRLHVILGDATTLEEPTYLALGMTSLVLAALEHEHRTGTRVLPDVALASPVTALREISHDPTLQTRVPLRDGTTATALEVQRRYFEAITTIADLDDAETADVLQRWRELLDLLDQDPLATQGRLEWTTKQALLERYADRHGLTPEDARLAAIDLQWSDLRAGKGIAQKMISTGRTRRVVTDHEIDQAVTTPPATTRAHLRGSLIGAHRHAVASAGWDVLTLGTDAKRVRLRLADPRAGSAHWCATHGIDPTEPLPDILHALERATTTDVKERS